MSNSLSQHRWSFSVLSKIKAEEPPSAVECSQPKGHGVSEGKSGQSPPSPGHRALDTVLGWSVGSALHSCTGLYCLITGLSTLNSHYRSKSLDSRVPAWESTGAEPMWRWNERKADKKKQQQCGDEPMAHCHSLQRTGSERGNQSQEKEGKEIEDWSWCSGGKTKRKWLMKEGTERKVWE